MNVIHASQYDVPCVVPPVNAGAQQVIDHCWEIGALHRSAEGVEFCVQLRLEVGPELWSERALRRSLPLLLVEEPTA